MPDIARDPMDAHYWAQFARWQRISSSNVLAIRYDYREKILSVQFKGIAKGVKFPIYDYKGVPPEVAREMYTSGSKGKFVWRVLRDGPYQVDGPK